VAGRKPKTKTDLRSPDKKPSEAVNVWESDAMSRFREIDEIESHRSIYEPLLREMGYQHVTYCHGPFERGKDFICLDANRLGHLDLTVVQIKNTKITGDSSSEHSAIGLLNQVDRCLHTKVLNPLTNREELPRQIIVFSSFPIPDYSVAGMGDRLDHLRRVCEIVAGSAVLALIEKYLPIKYLELVHPGQGMSAAMLRQLKVTAELSAIGVNRDRSLRSFFINIGVSSAKGPLGEITSGVLKLAEEGTRLTYPRQVFRAIESLATSATTTLNIRGLFKVIQTASSLRNSTHKSNDPSCELEGLVPTKEVRKRALSEEVTIEIGNFDHVLSALEDLKKTIEKEQPKDSDRFLRYISCIRNLNVMLDLLGSREPSNPLRSAILRVGIKERRRKYNLTFSELDPLLLVESKSSFAIAGEAGAGKTSLSRIVTELAIEKGLKCIYFPASRVENKTDELSGGLRKYLDSIGAAPAIQNIPDFLRSLDLVLIDGCDEAATFGTKKLARELRELHCGRNQAVEYEVRPGRDVFIPLDLRHCFGTQSIDRKRKSIWLKQAVPDLDFDRLLGFDENRAFERAIRELQRNQEQHKVNFIVTSRTVDPLDLSHDFSIFEALPFNDGQLDRFFRRWFDGNKRSYERITQVLDTNAHIKSICKTPMIATLVAALEENNYDLPKSRTEIYSNRFDLLLERWDRMRRVPGRVRIRSADKILLLSRLAFRIHKRNRSRFSGQDLESVWLDGISELYPEVTLDALIWELHRSNNVITNIGDDEYSFGHLSYQEFLVAKEVVNRQNPAFLVDKFEESWWRQVLIFYAGIAGNIDRLFDKLLSRRPISTRDSLVTEMSAEARYSSPALKSFLQ
jgi:hypothetical protein